MNGRTIDIAETILDKVAKKSNWLDSSGHTALAHRLTGVTHFADVILLLLFVTCTTIVNNWMRLWLNSH